MARALPNHRRLDGAAEAPAATPSCARSGCTGSGTVRRRRSRLWVLFAFLADWLLHVPAGRAHLPRAGDGRAADRLPAARPASCAGCAVCRTSAGLAQPHRAQRTPSCTRCFVSAVQLDESEHCRGAAEPAGRAASSPRRRRAAATPRAGRRVVAPRRAAAPLRPGPRWPQRVTGTVALAAQSGARLRSSSRALLGARRPQWPQRTHLSIEIPDRRRPRAGGDRASPPRRSRCGVAQRQRSCPVLVRADGVDAADEVTLHFSNGHTLRALLGRDDALPDAPALGPGGRRVLRRDRRGRQRSASRSVSAHRARSRRTSRGSRCSIEPAGLQRPPVERLEFDQRRRGPRRFRAARDPRPAPTPRTRDGRGALAAGGPRRSSWSRAPYPVRHAAPLSDHDRTAESRPEAPQRRTRLPPRHRGPLDALPLRAGRRDRAAQPRPRTLRRCRSSTTGGRTCCT